MTGLAILGALCLAALVVMVLIECRPRWRFDGVIAFLGMVAGTLAAGYVVLWWLAFIFGGD